MDDFTTLFRLILLAVTMGILAVIWLAGVLMRLYRRRSVENADPPDELDHREPRIAPPSIAMRIERRLRESQSLEALIAENAGEIEAHQREATEAFAVYRFASGSRFSLEEVTSLRAEGWWFGLIKKYELRRSELEVGASLVKLVMRTRARVSAELALLQSSPNKHLVTLQTLHESLCLAFKEIWRVESPDELFRQQDIEEPIHDPRIDVLSPRGLSRTKQYDEVVRLKTLTVRYRDDKLRGSLGFSSIEGDVEIIEQLILTALPDDIDRVWVRVHALDGDVNRLIEWMRELDGRGRRYVFRIWVIQGRPDDPVVRDYAHSLVDDDTSST